MLQLAKLEREEPSNKAFKNRHGVVEFGVSTPGDNLANVGWLWFSNFSQLGTMQCPQNGSDGNNVLNKRTLAQESIKELSFVPKQMKSLKKKCLM